MANTLLRGLHRVSLPSVLSFALPFRQLLGAPEPIFILSRTSSHFPRNTKNCWQVVSILQRRSLSHGTLTLVISREGKPKFETHEIDHPKKEKWKTKKRLKLQRKKEKQMRKAANKRDPRWLGLKGKKKRQRFSYAEERIKYKLEHVKFSSISWAHDNKGFFYSRYPAPSDGEKLDAGTETNVNLHHELYYHLLGTDQSEDILGWNVPDNPKHTRLASVTEDGKMAT